MAPTELISPQFRLPRSIILSAIEIIATRLEDGAQATLTLPTKPIRCFLSGQSGLVSEEYEIIATPNAGGLSFPIRTRFSLTIGSQGLFDFNTSAPIANLAFDFGLLGPASANVSAPGGFLESTLQQTLSRVGVQFKDLDGIERGYAITGSGFTGTFEYRGLPVN